MAWPQTKDEFEIYVIADRLIDILSYDYEDPAWRRLLEAPPHGTVIMTDEDIETYDWENQEIVLAPAASVRMRGSKLVDRSFVACLGGRPLFGGSFVEPGSARAIRYPVIHIDKSGPRVVLQLRPLHTTGESLRQLDADLRARIMTEDLRRHFKTLGRLR